MGTYCEDGADCFPAQVLKSIRPDEAENLLMVVFTPAGSDKTRHLFLVESTDETRNEFLECLRILCIYAQSSPKIRARRTSRQVKHDCAMSMFTVDASACSTG